MIGSIINSLKNQLFLIGNKIQQENLTADYITLELPVEQPITLKPLEINDSFFLCKPDSNFTMLGLGSFLTLKTEGEQRLNLIKTRFSKILNSWYQFKQSDFISPIAFLAFAFDANDPMKDKWTHFPNTLLTIPTVLIKQNDSKQVLQVNIKLQQVKDESLFSEIEDLLTLIFTTQKNQTNSNKNIEFSTQEEYLSGSIKKTWQSLAEKAISQIQSGHFDKLVASRQHSLQTSDKISQVHLIQDLIKYYPSCTILSYHIADKSILAASPERLVTLQHPLIQSDALGGTIFRPEQKNKASNNSSQKYTTPLPFFLKEKNNQTEIELSESEKLLKEHDFISQTIYQSLDPLCHTLKMPVSPYLMKLQNLYHLETPVQGKLMDNYDLFDAIEVLHPTPAVAGLPTQEAKKWLLDNENYHRGWYTGAFGWLDGHKNGDLSVMLRCALINSNKKQLDLFAGAGLVAESTPNAEWLETELKIHTILEML